MALLIEQSEGRDLHRLFKFGIALKGLYGIFEVISGSLVLFITKNSFTNIFNRLTRGELIEDPNDRLVTFLASALQHISTNTKLFAALYIFIHGLLNIFLAVQLHKKRLWAYPVTISAMILFMSYQMYRIFHTHSIVLILITIWDITFIAITWHEYKNQKSIIATSRKHQVP